MLLFLQTEHRAVGNSTFRKLWRQLTPDIVITKPRTDICWECHQNNSAIYRSANLPNCVKSAKLQKQEEHLRIVEVERDIYRKMVDDSKTVASQLSLGRHEPCSMTEAMHYSFDFAQQVHYPNDPLQPGPMYFLCPRKCGVFGICCEGIPQQVNFLVDESHCTSKGANSVISYLDFFFDNFCLGECSVHLHCDNCSGQNKNRFMIWYLLWRCSQMKHKEITLNFLITGHTKFAPDWCFGLFKQLYRRTSVSCLDDIVSVVNNSTLTNVNIAQLVGDESGKTFVPCFNWQSFLECYFKPMPSIKKFHHFRFSSSEFGIVYAKQYSDSAEEHFNLCKNKCTTVIAGQPDIIPSPGLDIKRQWYLFNSIRDFCSEAHQDTVCPKPMNCLPVVEAEAQEESTDTESLHTEGTKKLKPKSKKKSIKRKKKNASESSDEERIVNETTRSGRKVRRSAKFQ